MNGSQNPDEAEKSKLVGFTSFEGGLVHERLLRTQIKQRTQILRHLTSDDIKEVADRLGLIVVDFKLDDATDWCVVATPFKGFEIYYLLQRYSPEFEDILQVLYSRSALELRMPAEDVSHLTLVYVNSLIYAAKLLGKKLPKLSEYL